MFDKLNFARSALTLVAMTAFGTPSAANDNLMLVLDSSGSMAGQIDGEVKLDIARTAVSDILGSVNPETQLGLVAYGHRKKGQCNDIELIHPLGQPDKPSVSKAIGQLRAIGKTPLSQAVKTAAEQMNFSEEKSTVVLISDGVENCGMDPCQLGAELEAQGVDFTVHVVGFDLGSSEDAGLQCLAQATGGLYIAADDAAGLQNAVQKTVQEAQVKPAAIQVPKPVTEPEPAETNLPFVVNVVHAPGGETWDGAINIRVLSKQTQNNSEPKEVARALRKKSGYSFDTLPDGEYTLEVKLSDHGHILKTWPIKIGAGQENPKEFSLNIGQLRLDASLGESGSAHRYPMGWTVSERKTNLSGDKTVIAKLHRKKSGEVMVLPEGEWSITGTLSDARYLSVTQDIRVVAGQSETLNANFNAGLVKLDASLASGVPLSGYDLGWSLQSTKKDLSGVRKTLANFHRDKTGGVYLVPAGDWHISGYLSDFRDVTAGVDISVQAEGEEAVTVDFNAGRIRFDVSMDGKEVTDPLSIRIFSAKTDLSGKRTEIAGYHRKKSGYVAVLPVGDHVAEIQLSGNRAISGSFEFSLGAGEEFPIEVSLSAK